jgi:hypothetical protein
MPFTHYSKFSMFTLRIWVFKSGVLKKCIQSRWFQTVSNCSCWETSIGQPVLFEYCTGCECHPSNQTLQCPVVTIRCFITFGMVFSPTWLEFKDMAQDPLVRQDTVSASCNLRSDEGLETHKCSLYPKEHPANCPLRWRLSNGLVSNCSYWQMSIGQPVLFENCTGCECHPSNQTLQCPVVTIRCFPWSAGSWRVFHIVGLCVFSHQSADYSIAIFVLVIFTKYTQRKKLSTPDTLKHNKLH